MQRLDQQIDCSTSNSVPPSMLATANYYFDRNAAKPGDEHEILSINFVKGKDDKILRGDTEK